MIFGYPDIMIEPKEILFACSEEIRLRIAFLVKDSEICVNCLVAVLQMPQSTISRHIGIMRRAGVIKARRKGANTYYSDNHDQDDTGRFCRDLLDTCFQHLSSRTPFSSDRENLHKQKHVCTVERKVA